MKEWYINIIVQKMRKYKGKMITSSRLKELVHNVLDDQYNNQKAYKATYFLKNKGHLISIKKDLFIVKAPTKEYSEDEILQWFYRDVLKKHCKEYNSNERYIWWLKALELNISNYAISDEIEIINAHKQATEVVILDKKILYKKYTSNQKNLFPLFRKHTHKIKIGKYTFHIANIELALLESLYNPDILHHNYTKELIKKILKKYKKHFQRDTVAAVMKNNKHHSSANRLYQLCRHVDEPLAESLAIILKKYSFILQSSL